MKAVHIYGYIYLGTTIWYLQALRDDEPVNETGFLKYNVRRLNTSLDSYGLKVSKRASEELTKYCEGLSDEEGATVSAEEAANVRKLSQILRATIDAESRGIFSYEISEKRYDSSSMISDVWKLFGDQVRLSLADVAVHDIEEAAKCIVFERPTAAAFHLMRAAESTLKELYCHLIKRERVAFMWGPMIAHLRKRKVKVDPALVDHLDNIRRNFRNPTQHPEKIYNMTEAQDLLGVCIDVINRMAPYLPSRE